jgi:hypothetical protein
MFDLIGDIHGYAFELKALLMKMVYRQENGACASRGSQSDCSWGFSERVGRIDLSPRTRNFGVNRLSSKRLPSQC